MQFVLCALTGYLIGNINPSYIIARLRGFDIRERGSGNAGASNAVMTMGRKVGAASALFDIFKAFLASMLAAQLFPQIKFAKILSGCSCIIGHIYPVFMGFHGGKGLASLAGTILAFDPDVFISLLILEIIIGFSFDYICVVPITGSAIFMAYYAFVTGDASGTLLLAVIAVIILFKHVENLRRIQNGTEAHLSFLWKKDQELERIKKNEH
ncbi:glycerol-3-phosphate acyltransferase [uncultured Ruminococcus sp.]|uniref:glycerol-3-phosphate acyltransferase n=1 Tax=uncultured Ruminococcus sp. TaxID=165186 RepID=UPI001564ABBB|nr:glycerol-3-phosphate acyltransferase [uncultured Ruminococcus sp.]